MNSLPHKSSSFQDLEGSDYNRLVSRMPLGFCLYEPIFDDARYPVDFRFIQVNATYAQLVGLQYDDFTGQTALGLWPDSEPAWLEILARVVTTGQPARVEKYSGVFGRELEVVAFLQAVDRLVLILTDISERKAAERKQAQIREALESMEQQRKEELQQRMEESERLNSAMVNLLDDIKNSNLKLAEISRRLAESNAELEAFTYSVSHDLRAPLRGMDGFSKILLEEYEERMDAQGRHYLHRIRAAANRMGSLIDDLLRLSRVSRAEMNIVAMDLSGMAAGITDQLRETAAEKKFNVVIEQGLHARGDPRLMHIVLENLLGNAFKFSGKAEEPRIEFDSEQGAGETIFKIRDNGAGFDMQYVDNLFGAFQRLHHSEEFEGSGIGLSIVKRIIRRHSGNVWAEGAPGKGATFYFTLPSNKESA